MKLIYLVLHLFYASLPYNTKIIKYTPKTIIEQNIPYTAFYSYIFSTLHAIFISTNSILYLNNHISKTSYINSLYYTYYYMISDIFIMHKVNYFKKIRTFMTIHHLLLVYNIIKVSNNLIQHNNITHIVARLFLAEIAVIFMNMNWFLIKFSKKNTNAFVISNSLFKVSYYIFRILNFSKIMLNYMKEEENYYRNKEFLSLAIIVILNYYWFFNILLK